MTLINQLNLSARAVSLFLADSVMGLTLIASQLLGRCANLLFFSTLSLRYLTPQLLRQCDIAFLRCDTSYNKTQYAHQLSKSKGFLSGYNSSVNLPKSVKQLHLSFYSLTRLTSTMLNSLNSYIRKSLNTVTVNCHESSTDKLIYKILDTFNLHLTLLVTIN